MAEKPENTFALGVYLQLLYLHQPGIAKTEDGFVKNFFDIILDTYRLEEFESKNEAQRPSGKTTIKAGVWKGINETDLNKIFNGKRRLPSWKARSFAAHVDQSALENLLSQLSIDALEDFQRALADFGITVETLDDLPAALTRWLQAILNANSEGKDILADKMTIAPMLEVIEGIELSKGRIEGQKLKLGRSQVRWPDASKPPVKPDTDIEGRYIHQLCLAFGSFDQVNYAQDTDLPEHHQREYQEQRVYFWEAQGLNRNLRDLLEDQDVFDQLKDDLYDGVIDSCRDDHPDGLKRMRATLTASTRTQLTASAIAEFPALIKNRHRKGMCHILTNEGRIMWVEEENDPGTIQQLLRDIGTITTGVIHHQPTSEPG